MEAEVELGFEEEEEGGFVDDVDAVGWSGVGLETAGLGGC